MTSLLKPKPTFFDRQPDRLAVIGHDLRRAGLEGGLEGDQVIVEIVARVDLLFAVGEMRVLAVFLRTAAGEVLGHAGHAVRAERLALEAADVGGDHARGKLRHPRQRCR